MTTLGRVPPGRRSSTTEPVGASVSPTSEPDRVFESILASDTFSKAFVLRQLLRYLWEHRAGALDEHTIAVHALNRKPDFDPKIDSAVRVTMTRLRGKLKEFYDGEGRDCPLWLWIPRNGYDLEYRFTAAPPADAQPAPPVSTRVPRSSWRFALAGLACFAAGSLVALVALDRASPPPPGPAAAQTPSFWRTFFSGTSRTLLVLPDSVFLLWPDRKLAVGDSTVDAFSSWNSSPLYKQFAARFGEPDSSVHYVKVQDALAAIQITQYLEGFGAPVKVVAGRDLAVDSFLGTNVILVGLPETMYQLKTRMARLQYAIASNGESIRNIAPQPGEPATFQRIRQTDRRVLSHGVFALMPGRTPVTHTLVLASANPLMVMMLVSSAGPLAELDRKLQAIGSPKHFQGVVEMVAEGNALLRIRIVSIRPFVAK